MLFTCNCEYKPPSSSQVASAGDTTHVCNRYTSCDILVNLFKIEDSVPFLEHRTQYYKFGYVQIFNLAPICERVRGSLHDAAEAGSRLVQTFGIIYQTRSERRAACRRAAHREARLSRILITIVNHISKSFN